MDSDTHLCLACNTTIEGLLNYVQHKQTTCPANKASTSCRTSLSLPSRSSPQGHLSSPSWTDNNGVLLVSPSNGFIDGLVSDPPTKDNFCAMKPSDIDATHNINDNSEKSSGLSVDVEPIPGWFQNSLSPNSCVSNLVNPNVVLNSSVTADKPENFFSSLELQSKGDNGTGSSKLKHQRRNVFDSEFDRATFIIIDEEDLSISKIFNSLCFSSDEQASSDNEESDEDDDDYERMKPPRTHTGGKWKPGDSPFRISVSGDVGKSLYVTRSTTRNKHPHPGFTGGKWKPGTREEKQSLSIQDDGKAADESVMPTSPDIAAASPQIEEKSDSGRKEIDEVPSHSSGHTSEGALIADDTTQVELSKDTVKAIPLICTICNKEYFNNYVMARHLLSKFHQSRAMNHPESLTMLLKFHRYIVRMSPYQCLICMFYFNRVDDLLNHLKTSSHATLCGELQGPLYCATCKYKTYSNDELIAHIMSEKNHRLKENKLEPCIIRESRHKVKCRYCSIVVHSVTRLNKHIAHKHPNKQRSEHRPRSLGRHTPLCIHCGVKCMSKSALEVHMRRKHTMERPFMCTLCNKGFCDNAGLKMHYKSVLHSRNSDKTLVKLDVKKEVNAKGRRMFKCDHCDFMARSYYNLRPHYMAEHSNQARVCEICDVTVYSDLSMIRHTERLKHAKAAAAAKGNTEVFSCELCLRHFRNKESLRLHEEIHHFNASMESAMEDVHRGTDPTSQMFSSYLDGIQLLTKSDSVTCPECKKVLIKEHIMEHLRLHSGDRPYKCRYCEKEFVASTTLRKHLQGHLGFTNRKCETCGKEFKKISSYTMHLKTHISPNSPENPHICEICGRAFAIKWQLSVHQKRHGQKSFVCSHPDCTWKFYYESELVSHQRTHTGEKPYLCHNCGYAAATKTRLVRHNRTHTGERNHHCEYCTYKASNTTHLRRHMRIHIGSKPYLCPYCPYACNTHENIRKHILKTAKHAGLKIYPCRFCNYGTNISKEFRNHLITDHSQDMKDGDMEVLSVFSGLYKKEQDPRTPPEGAQILPVREPNRRSKKKVVPLEDLSIPKLIDIITSTGQPCPTKKEAVVDEHPLMAIEAPEQIISSETYSEPLHCKVINSNQVYVVPADGQITILQPTENNYDSSTQTVTNVTIDESQIVSYQYYAAVTTEES